MPFGRKSKGEYPLLPQGRVKSTLKEIKNEMHESESHFAPPVPPRPSNSRKSPKYVEITPVKSKSNSQSTPYQTPEFSNPNLGSPPMSLSPGILKIFEPPNLKSPTNLFRNTRQELLKVNPLYFPIGSLDAEDELNEPPPVYNSNKTRKSKSNTRKSKSKTRKSKSKTRKTK